VLPQTEHILVYNATALDGNRNPVGVYNHGPIITKYNGVFFISWYNAPVNESWFKRSVYAVSTPYYLCTVLNLVRVILSLHTVTEPPPHFTHPTNTVYTPVYIVSKECSPVGGPRGRVPS
jgi:hypothetical protein